MVLLNKADLADGDSCARWTQWFENQGICVVKIDARNRGTLKAVQAKVGEACREKIERDRRRGILNPADPGDGGGNSQCGKIYFYQLLCR